MRATLTLREGTIPWRALTARFPFDIYLTAAHRAICLRLAAEAEPEDRETYYDLLFIKSWRARELTALWWLLELEPDRLVAIHVPYAKDSLERLLGRALPAGVRVAVGGSPSSDVSLRQVAQVTLKAVLHAWYRRRGFRPGLRLRPDAVRAYTSLTSHLFAEELPGASVLVYPVAYGWEGHLAYLRELRARHPSVHTAGLPFAVGDLARAWCALPSRRGRALARAERRAGAAHGRELRAAGVSTLYAADEFEVPSLALHTAFREAGGRSICATHGIGVYVPRVGYDEMRIISDAQRAFYAAEGPGIRFRYLRGVRKSPPLPTGDGFQPGVVVIDQYTSYQEYRYEVVAQQDLLARARAAAAAAGLPVAIKAHPSLSTPRARALAAESGVPVFHRWEDSPIRDPIVLTIKSTVLIELAGVLPVFALDDGRLMPELYFGPGLPTFTYRALPALLDRLKDPEGWASEVARQGTWNSAAGAVD